MWSKETTEYIDAVQAQLEKLGVLEETDKRNLKFLGDAVDLYSMARQQLLEEGITVYDNNNRKVANPAFSVMRSQQAMITALFKELSISTRQRRMLAKDEIIDEQTPLGNLIEELKNI